MPTSPRLPRRLTALVFALTLGMAASACGSDADSSTGDTSDGHGEKVTLRLGYFPNLTHAPGIVGDTKRMFQQALGDQVTVETSTFNAGPEAIEALFADALDITFIGPNPAINAYAQSDGQAVRIISGSTSGGAFLVTKPEITSVEDLEGTTIATPQLGNTQDVALRSYLKEHGLSADESGGGDVSIEPQANAEALAAFISGDIDGAWVPEPFASRFQIEGNGTVLVDEADLWPDGKYVTTHVIVRKAFLDDHPDIVEAFLQGLHATIEFIDASPDEAKAAANDGIEAISGKRLGDEVIDAAWDNLTFTLDPIASSLQKSAEDAEAVGLLDAVDLSDPGIYDLTHLNAVLKKLDADEVEGL